MKLTETAYCAVRYCDEIGEYYLATEEISGDIEKVKSLVTEHDLQMDIFSDNPCPFVRIAEVVITEVK